MDEILVSIGIPMYNAERFLKNTIQSVLNQTYTNFELIITDDGSSDRSIEIIKSFKDSRIILIADGCNKGISYRLNQQIQIAKGKYFFRMDADDLMFPERVKTQVDYLENNPNIDAVGTPVVVLNDENEIISFRDNIDIKEYNQLFNTILFNHPTVAGKLEYFKKFLYSEKLAGVEDADLWIRSYPSSKFSHLKEPLLFYRDPLVFKLRTYKSRLYKKNQLYKENTYLKEHFIVQQKLILKNYSKIFIASILNFLKMDYLLIARRNDTNIKIEKYWVDTLKKIINGA